MTSARSFNYNFDCGGGRLVIPLTAVGEIAGLSCGFRR
jgi:hypothetical protein